MWSRLAIVAGLLAGVAVAAGVLGGILVAGPAPTAPPPEAYASPSPSPSPAAPSATIATPTASATATPSTASPSASGFGVPGGSLAPSGSAAPSGSGAPTASPATLFHIGEKAPALVLPKVGGGTINLADLKGTPVWVDFMGTYCPPCQDEFSLMNGFAARYADAGLVIVAVDIKEDEASVATFANGLDTTFPIALDNDGAAAARWGAYALPVHYWIDADGIVRDGAFGGIGPDIMARGVASILPGVDVQP
jgi:thiol-disulfide isomerase/thioredoxin